MKLLSKLRSEPPQFVELSPTGRTNEALRAAWSCYYADRALLLFSFVWLAIRLVRHSHIAARPLELYDPPTWIGTIFFPASFDERIWYLFFAIAFCAVCTCFWKPGLVLPRMALAVAAAVILSSEFTHDKVYHMDHLFLFAHLFAVFLPVSRPGEGPALFVQAEAANWYQAGLLMIYSLSGVWKFVDMTVGAVVKPEMTWLNPNAMLFTSINRYYAIDLPLDVPRMLASIKWFFPFGYVALASIFAGAVFAAFRRPLMYIVLPTIVVFHLLNAVALFVFFVSMILVAVLLFAPYDTLSPISRRLHPMVRAAFQGRGGGAEYQRFYEGGDVDVFHGFYAYRARLTDRSVLLAAPLYLPLIPSLCSACMAPSRGNQPASADVATSESAADSSLPQRA